MTRLVLLVMLLSGCEGFPPRVEIVQIDDITIAEHIDTNDAPAECGDRSAWSGCYVQRLDGSHHIYRSSLVARHTVLHEYAHAAKRMRHDPWETDFVGRKCAKITASGGHYIAGKTLCIGSDGETIY